MSGLASRLIIVVFQNLTDIFSIICCYVSELFLMLALAKYSFSHLFSGSCLC